MYRDDLQALVARHNALDAEVMRARRERDQLRLLIDDAHQRLRLPVLDNVRPASPCSEDWSTMEGDLRVRSCARCSQSVYNLSELTREEAHALLSQNDAVCVKYFRRSDGTILTKDCTVGKQTRRYRRVIAAGIAASIAAVTYVTVRGGPAVVSPPEPMSAHETMTQGDDYLGGAPGNLADEFKPQR